MIDPKNIHDIVAGKKDEVYLDETEWLMNVSADEIEQLYKKFASQFEAALVVCEETLGIPDLTKESDADWINEWFIEAFQIVGWRKKNHIYILSAEHHDRDTPITLSFRRHHLDEFSEE